MPIEIGDSTATVRSKINEVLTDAGLNPADNVNTTAATALLNQAAGLWDVDVEFTDRMPEAEFRTAFAALEEGVFYRERVVNGRFENGTTGWTPGSGATLSVVNGQLNITNGGAFFGYATQAVPTSVGKTYTVTLEGKSANAFVSLGTSANGTQYITNTFVGNGSFTREIVATSAALYINLKNATNTPGEVQRFDNVSVKLLPLA